MTEESKVVDLEIDEEATKDALNESVNGVTDLESGDEVETIEAQDADSVAAGSAKKKKKSKKAKLKKVLGVGNKEDGDKDASGSSSNPSSKITSGMVEQILTMNPSLKAELSGKTKEGQTEAVRKMDVSELLTGMAISGKNQKTWRRTSSGKPSPSLDSTKPWSRR